MGFKVINGKLQFYSDYNVTPSRNNTKDKKVNNNFENLLEKKINNKYSSNKDSFTISKHAAERLRLRDINLNEEDMNNINKAINEAELKGCKEGLILLKDTALVTSIKNRTIITAMTKDESKGNVFTNIDSVVIL
ncbi:TIGR02530 family flagellar biosynthesis protein [Clostridium niameyense]|uniref:TIGR02530 family flagellar biosynthesis protein n=1 Tax=Clostridium niameyense TaxID=1622073 RepID=UPI00067F52B8|nr:TIGR02530 family flagellar biosynthesis protein [Clostridium niameyense]